MVRRQDAAAVGALTLVGGLPACFAGWGPVFACRAVGPLRGALWEHRWQRVGQDIREALRTERLVTAVVLILLLGLGVLSILAENA
ncbi:hypothetical protein [Streptomyces sp. NPDC047071]|uniref:hypothetical protein n=1 Tax=Streptomyces sp. NPDC047071 TaxID=3154808 RepID=UPI0034520EA5